MTQEINMTTPDNSAAGFRQTLTWMAQQVVDRIAMREPNMEHGIPYFARCKRTNQLCVVAYYGADSGIRGTDQNFYRQLVADYDIGPPVMVPADVLDWMSTLRIGAVAERDST